MYKKKQNFIKNENSKKNLFWINEKIFIISINFLVLLILWLILELVTGNYFFKKKNFVCTKFSFKYIPCNMNNQYILNGLYDYKESSIVYKRDQYGFRGRSKTIKNIDIITVGGSTTDERFIDEKLTWSEQLEYLINNSIISKKIDVVNAGIDGQSTFGHIWNFENWFNKIDNFSPKYIIFYMGLNERESQNKYKLNLDFQNKNYGYKNLSFFNKIKFLIKINNGFTYSLYRHINNFYITKFSNLTQSVLRHGNKKYTDHYVVTNNNQLKINDQFSENLKKRLLKIKNYSEKINTIPIFVTQRTHRWEKFGDNILHINKSTKNYYLKEKYIANLIKKFSNENDILFIDLFNIIQFNQRDTYDYFHTTPSGSFKIAKIIFNNLQIYK